MKEVQFNDPEYLGRFLWFVIALGVLLAMWSRWQLVSSAGNKSIGHYAVDESPSYLVWYAIESFPGELKSSLKPK